ncbi:hypothetical protein [Stutzerimonas frequens]|uniref:hypothetical protein n=1 Tax=Stutzerimonas frequens TaxID=2968969 RepID=UPI0019098202|nr:hypothetical protein [Stutzerimonas frequens]MBK3757044.1 hypothetical protein [Stutzerimonas frequens]MBK3871654.1 hypothetical protein [Stutzerimonas frequens]MBK3909989.1 hypothetical protein [Stutzerimonas frequens]MBK3928442.1 hypothetical protein [Stutzerimonas frequens]
MTVRNAAEQAALVTTPVPVGVSGMTMFGITLQDWVFIGTAMLLVFQIIVFLPKVRDAFKSLFGKEKPNDRTERAS